MSRILIACEYSGRTRDAFLAKGHEAMSCDFHPTEVPGPHYQGDVRDILYQDWDLIIAHPDCTYLTNAGVRWLHERPERWADLEKACEFFNLFLDHPCERICVENPIPHKYAVERLRGNWNKWGSGGQTVQPYEFGEPTTKRTCYWLKGLPKLVGTKNVYAEMMELTYAERAKVHYASPGPDRWKFRSRTPEGFSKAMAEQWG